MTSPYAIPQSNLQGSLPESESTSAVAIEHKSLVYAVMANLAALPISLVSGVTGFLIGLFSLLLIVRSVSQLGKRMGVATVIRWMQCALVLVPIANLLFLVILHLRVTRYLRRHGYVVGLLGADQREISRSEAPNTGSS